MSAILSNLTTYVDQLSGGLAKAIILQANTISDDLVKINYGVKGNSYALNVLSFTPIGKSNDGCSTFITSGQTVFAQPTVTMCPIKFEDNVCINDLHKYYTAWEMTASMKGESLPFEEIFMSTKAEATAAALDSIFWKGASSSPAYASVSGNDALCDGLLQKAYANSASTVNISGKTISAITSSNASYIVDAILSAVTTNIPQILDEFNLYLSPADFQNYLIALRNLNLFQYTTESKNVKEIYHPGSIGMKIVKTNGLKGAPSCVTFATTHDNAQICISAEEDLTYDSWFDKPTDSLSFRLKTRIGCGFYQPELVLRIS